MFKLDAIEEELKLFFLRYPLGVLIIYGLVKMVVLPYLVKKEIEPIIEAGKTAVKDSTKSVKDVFN